MKKLIYLFFAVVVFAFFSCGDTENSQGNIHNIELEGSSCGDDLKEVSTPCCATKKDTSDCEDSKK